VPQLPGYRVFDERFAFLFNSYYVAAGPRHARPQRGMITRPTAAEVTAYRAYVDAAVARLLDEAASAATGEILRVLEVGLHHEQQHQELMLTDILHAFSLNPTHPAYDPEWTDHNQSDPGISLAELLAYDALESGIYRIGHEGNAFSFDNETPSHQVLIQPVKIAKHLVTNGQWLEFMQDGGYEKPALWLSDGWAMVEAECWRAPLYWREVEGKWSQFTLGGLRPLHPASPVMHVSYYEADAFARWAGKFLPTEAEWEVAARAGNLADADGKVWQWTRSAYLPYPGYRAAEGALGEYNGKFMVNQMVLRGSSLATPAGHARVSYRNFFYPPHRWQFMGLRLADYV
jgi:ergothioneine biosynthesis protein EgtB